jgi:hypothetical protein
MNRQQSGHRHFNWNGFDTGIHISSMHCLKLLIGFSLLRCAAVWSEPRFYHSFDTLNDDVYNKKFVFAAAESCGVDTNADLIRAAHHSGNAFINVLPFKGHYRILRTQRIDAQWELDRLVMYGCFDPVYDTVFVVDSLPEASPHVIGFKNEKKALSLYLHCNRYIADHYADHHLTGLEKITRNNYSMRLVKGYSGYNVEFQIIADTISVIRTQQWTY